MWYDPWLETIIGSLHTVRVHLPSIAGVILFVLLGWVLAILSRRWSRRLTERLLDRLGATSLSTGRAVESSGARRNTPGIVSAFVFWLVILFFLAAAAETLGLPVMTDLLGRIAAYGPNLLAAVLIALAGLIAARLVRSAMMRAAKAGGVAQARGVSTAAEVVVIALVVVIVLEQVGVNGRVLELMVAVTVGSALAAVALAFGFGARTSVANLIAAHYVARLLTVGQTVVIDDIKGMVIQLTPTAVILKTSEGHVAIPAQRFQETSTVIVREEA